MQNAMLDLMRAFAAAALADEAEADDLFDRAREIEEQLPEAAKHLRATARRHRVRSMEMRAKGAAMGERYNRLF